MLRRASHWSADWDLPLNATKCYHLPIGQQPQFSLSLSTDNSQCIPVVESARDLGIQVSSSFTPTLNCIEAANKARRILFLIRRSFARLTPSIFLPLYTSMVRPHLEYCVQANSPYLRKDIDHLEKVQRLATRMVAGYRELDYEERLGRLNLFTLARRRLRSDLLTAFHIFTGRINIPVDSMFRRPERADLHKWRSST